MADGRKNNGGHSTAGAAGRPTKHDELLAKNLAIAAVIKIHGSMQAGFEWCLNSDEASLNKFALEHAFGKPTDKVQVSAPDGIQLLFTKDANCTPIAKDN